MKSFLRELEHLFRFRSLLYVDVGAYRGETFKQMLKSRLTVHEAHLIEPNPTSFMQLQAAVAELSNACKVHIYNLALGDKLGSAVLRQNDTMSQIVPSSNVRNDEINQHLAHISMTTLDQLAKCFGRRQISILKVDVEGFEFDVLKGAQGLLESKNIDCLYIEAGMNADSERFCHYRELEDYLSNFGYKVFKIFEQQHEWPEDSPLLRRANVAFLSASFAAQNPYRLSRELSRTEKQLEILDAEKANLQRQHETLRSQHETLRSQHETLRSQHEKLQGERDRLQEVNEQKVRQAEKNTEARIRSHLSYRLGAEIVGARGSVRRAMGLPNTLLRTYREFMRERASITNTTGIRRTAGQLKSKGRLHAEVLETRLWGGFSTDGLRDLAKLRGDATASQYEQVYAAWALARWFATHGDPARALGELEAMPAARAKPSMRRRLLEAQCLCQLGRRLDARRVVEEGLARRGRDNNLFLAMANTYQAGDVGDLEADRERLRWINRIYEKAGFAPLAVRDADTPLTLDNLTALPPPPCDVRDGPTVSIIMPVFNAADTLPTALRSLLAQTWRALEIIVVDDCSPDDTIATAEAFAAEDDRIRIIRQSANEGSYAARNAGLVAARGAYITTHDADDWSHPQKIEMQMRLLRAQPEAAACFSGWVRCSSDLRFGWLHRPWESMIAKNITSILMHRERFDVLGGWDRVRVSADTELLRRVEHLFGKSAVKLGNSKKLPLAFGRHESRSLTQQKLTHVSTMLHGPRQEYHEASQFWRESVPAADLRIDPCTTLSIRPFPAPVSIATKSNQHEDADLLFISDLPMRGGAFVSKLNQIKAAIAAGRSVAIFHWQRYDLVGMEDRKKLNPAIRTLAQQGQLRIVAAGEAIRARTVIIGYPVILKHAIDLLPKIMFDQLVIVVNQMASRLHGGGDPQYDPRLLRANVQEWFCVEATWAPISGLVQRLMREDDRYPEPHADVWTPLISTEDWFRKPIKWRGADRARPVVGRHSRDHYTKWPSRPDALTHAYCADRACQIELLGGARHALSKVGRRPTNWTIYPFDHFDAERFLARLDFFVHYPHEDYIEEFGRAVLEALAAGVPAILPPVFEDTFGEAALYAEPQAVWPTIEALWADEKTYRERAEPGRALVMEHCA